MLGNRSLEEKSAVFMLEEVKFLGIELDTATGEFEGQLNQSAHEVNYSGGEIKGQHTASATSSRTRGVWTPRLKEAPKLASQAWRAMGKTFWSMYVDRLTLSLRLLSLEPSLLMRRPRWANVGGSQPKA